MKVYNKLVRDKIPAIMSEEEKKFVIHIASKEEYVEKLKEKLLEEVNEFLEEPCLEELADIFEVLSALVHDMGYPQEDLIKCMEEKADSHGTFDSRIILESVED